MWTNGKKKGQRKRARVNERDRETSFAENGSYLFNEQSRRKSKSNYICIWLTHSQITATDALFEVRWQKCCAAVIVAYCDLFFFLLSETQWNRLEIDSGCYSTYKIHQIAIIANEIHVAHLHDALTHKLIFVFSFWGHPNNNNWMAVCLITAYQQRNAQHAARRALYSKLVYLRSSAVKTKCEAVCSQCHAQNGIAASKKVNCWMLIAGEQREMCLWDLNNSPLTWVTMSQPEVWMFIQQAFHFFSFHFVHFLHFTFPMR